MSERLKKITHRGRSILFTDYSQFSAWEEWQELIAAEHELMPGQPLGSVRALAVFTGARFSTQVSEALRKLAVANKPYIKASALVGLSSLQRAIFLKGIEQTSSRAFGLFDTVEEALDWLVEQE